jgi:hypothetical protein
VLLLGLLLLLVACFAAVLQKKTMKKVLHELTGTTNPNDKVLVALSAVTKMHVGELVATGGCYKGQCNALCIVTQLPLQASSFDSDDTGQ